MNQENVNKFIIAFNKIKDKPYPSGRKGNTGIGKTLEDAMEIMENNISLPDFHDIEIKSQRALCESYVTLFTKAPTMPKRANSVLRLTYGSPDKDYPQMKVLHTSVFHNKWNTHISNYSFKLNCNDKEEKLYLLIKDLRTNKIISNEVYWAYEVLKRIIINKLKTLAFVSAKVEHKDDKEIFTFTECILYNEVSFKKLIDYIKTNKIMFDIRIGAYKTGEKAGKTHDHGSGFRIKRSELGNFYKNKIKLT